jgi:hypothetical protein
MNRGTPATLSVVAQTNASHDHSWKLQSGVGSGCVSLTGIGAVGRWYFTKPSAQPKPGQVCAQAAVDAMPKTRPVTANAEMRSRKNDNFMISQVFREDCLRKINCIRIPLHT